MADTPTITLRPGRERAIRQGHPWVLSGSVDRVEGEPAAGDLVRVRAAGGGGLGLGDYDPDSQIRVRLLAFGPDAELGDDWLAQRIGRALAWRAACPDLQGTDALRLVHSEADGLPGLTIDRYAGWLAVKLGTPAMARRAPRLAECLEKVTQARGAWLRGDAPGSREDRALFGSVPEEAFPIEERGRTYHVDLRRGQKTGFYLDQRDARDLFERLAPGARALDLYAYTGGFAVAAQKGGAREVVAVESSPHAVALLRQNARDAEVVAGDVAEFLRGDPRRFDLIALDPPPFARRKRDVQSASRAYKALHLNALERAAPGAYLLSFSCSHHVGPDLFRKLVFGAALEAERELQVLGQLGAPPDHACSIYHPQGEYLCGLLLRVVA